MTTEGTQNGDGIDVRKERAIIALLAEATVKKAAEVAGISEATLHRWMDDPDFDRAFKGARRKVLAHAISLSQKYASLAVNFLGRCIQDPAAPYPSRVQAAQAMLKFSRESIELDEMQAKVAALEAAQKEHKR
jgi:hypothetical protein